MRYRYLKDPVFLVCLATYFINRWFIKPHVHGGFFHTSFNDCITIPFWVPIMLWMMRRLGLRRHDDPPNWIEIAVPILIWSWVFKVWLPYVAWLPRRPAPDPMDILCFAAGGLASMVVWNRIYARAVSSPSPAGRTSTECPVDPGR